MKKKIIGIACSAIGIILISGLLTLGIVQLVRQKNVAETGNVLGVSWYNETDTEFTISTEKEFYEFAKLSNFYTFEKQTIKLGADLVLNEGSAVDWKENAPGNRWKPIDGFAGTFDGQGHTISGLYGKAFNSPMALFTNTTFRCTVRDLKLVNSYFESTGSAGTASFVSNGGGKMEKLYSDAIFEGNGGKVGGIASIIREQASFDECWYEGSIHAIEREVGGIVDVITRRRVTIKNCLFSGAINNEYDYAGTRTGGIVGLVNDTAVVIVEECLSSGKITTTTNQTGAVFGVLGSGITATLQDSYVTSGVYTNDVLVGALGSENVLSGRALAMQKEVLSGTNAYRWTTLDFETYWAAQEDATPVLKYFVGDELSVAGVEKAYDLSWYDSDSYNFEIMNLKQLYGLTYLSSRDTFSGKTVKLGADIIVNEGNAKSWGKAAPENPWFPIGTFAGIFDGQGHTISGIYLNTISNYQGLFSQVGPTGKVQNLSLKNSYFNNYSTEYAFMGSIAGQTAGNMENIYSNAILYSTGNQVGGIAGRATTNSTVAFRNCWFDGEVHMLTYAEDGKGAVEGGGIIGRTVKGSVDVEHCLNTGTITSSVTGRALYLGGIIGATYGSGNLNIKDTFNSGPMIADYNNCVASVIGRAVGGANRFIYITNTFATSESYNSAIGGSRTATLHGSVGKVPEALLTGTGGYKWTTLDFDEYWVAVNNGTPMLKYYTNSSLSVAGVKKMVDLSWNTDKNTLILDSVEDFYGFGICSGNNFSGKTIKLAVDVAINQGDARGWSETAPENPWYSIYTFAGTFDGQGHTISGIYVNTDQEYKGLFTQISAGGVIKNFSLRNSFFNNYSTENAFLGSIAGQIYGTMENVYSNAIVHSTGNQVGGLVGRTNKTDDSVVNIRNCWFDGEVNMISPTGVAGEGPIESGGFVGRLVQGDLNLEHCLFTGTMSGSVKGKGICVGGALGTIYGAGTLNMKDTLIAGRVNPGYNVYVGSVVGRPSTSTSRTVNITNTFATTESYTRTIGSNNYSMVLNGDAVKVPESVIKGIGGHLFTTLDFKQYWAAMDNTTPILKCFAGSSLDVSGVGKVVDFSWYSPNADTMVLDSREDLYGFMLLGVTNTFADKTLKMGADITLDKTIQWLPVGNRNMLFAGTFDGQGHTISGIYVDTTRSHVGFFGAIGPKGVVKNLRVTDSYFSTTGTESGSDYQKGYAYMGSIVGECRGTIDNVYSNAIIESSVARVGGIVGVANDNNKARGEGNDVSVSNAWFDGEIRMSVQDRHNAGGIIGFNMQNQSTISDCLFTGTISSEYTGGDLYVGGIIGGDANTSAVTITDCLSAGTLDVKHHAAVGSLVGCVNMANAKYYLTSCYGTNACYKNANGNAVTIGKKNAGSTVTGFAAAMEDALGVEGYRLVGEDWLAVMNHVPVPKVFKDLVKQETLLDTTGLLTYDVDWYDESGTYYIGTAEELYGFMKLFDEGYAFSSATIYLTADVAINEVTETTAENWAAGKETPVNPWNPLGNRNKLFAATFDGRGHTISGLYVNTTRSHVGFIGTVGQTGAVKNLRVTDSYFFTTGAEGGSDYQQGNAHMGSIAGECRGSVDNVYGNAILASPVARVGGIVGVANDTNTATGEGYDVSVSNAWFDGEIRMSVQGRHNAGGIVGFNMQNQSSISHCLFTGTITSEYTGGDVYAGGIVGGDANTSTVTITDCLSAGTLDVKEHSAVGSLVGCVNMTTAKYYLTACYATNECYKNADGESVTVGKKNGTCVNDGKLVALNDIKGEKAKETLSDLNFDYYWSVREKDVPELRRMLEVEDILSCDTSWYDGGSGTYDIGTPEVLYGFMKLMSDGKTFSGATIRLTADIAMNKVEEGTMDAWAEGKAVPINPWTPSGNNSSNQFAGTFDGQGHTISGIYVNSTTGFVGLFGAIGAKGIVQNLRLTDSYIYTSATTGDWKASAGSIAGYCQGEINTVYSNAIVEAKNERVGGITGNTNTGTKITKAWFDGEVRISVETKVGQRIGGIVGNQVNGSLSLSDCLFTGEIKNAYGTTYIGGFVGLAAGSSNVTVTNCLSAGEMTVSANATSASSLLNIGASATCTITTSYVAKDGYKKTDGTWWPTIGGNGAGNCKTPCEEIDKDSILGEKAEDVLKGFGFGTVWVTRGDDEVPALIDLLPKVESMSLYTQIFQTVSKLFDLK